MRLARQAGSMLVLALWGLALLTVFSLSLSVGVRQKAVLLQRVAALDALYPIAYSGVEKAKSLVSEDFEKELDTLADPWAQAPDAAKVQLAGGSFYLNSAENPGLVDEERKINLNFAGPEILYRLLQSAGLSQAEAEELAYCLNDWMDSDSFFGHPDYGAEDRYYEGLDQPYSAKDSAYESLDEALLVRNMTPALLKKLRPFVTVYGTGQVNINTAPREVLSALGFSSAGIDAIEKYRLGADGDAGTFDDLFFRNVQTVASDLKAAGLELDDTQEIVLAALSNAAKIGIASSFFSVTSVAEQEATGARLELEAVVDREARVRYFKMGEVQWPART